MQDHQTTIHNPKRRYKHHADPYQHYLEKWTILGRSRLVMGRKTVVFLYGEIYASKEVNTHLELDRIQHWDKPFVVFISNAIVYPYTVMVKLLYTTTTLSAVLWLWLDKSHTLATIHLMCKWWFHFLYFFLFLWPFWQLWEDHQRVRGINVGDNKR